MMMTMPKFLSALLCLVSTANAFHLASVPRQSTTALRMNVETFETRPNVKVGVIGMGRIGVVHLEAISKAPGVTCVMVSNPTIEKAEKGTLQQIRV